MRSLHTEKEKLPTDILTGLEILANLTDCFHTARFISTIRRTSAEPVTYGQQNERIRISTDEAKPSIPINT